MDLSFSLKLDKEKPISLSQETGSLTDEGKKQVIALALNLSLLRGNSYESLKPHVEKIENTPSMSIEDILKELNLINTVEDKHEVVKSSNFKKTFPFDNCKSCTRTYGKTQLCKTCNGTRYYDELYNADPNCVHKITSAGGGGIKCEKCGGWFCF